MYVDTMVPELLIPEQGDNSTREMWLVREFLDHKAFRRGLTKYAIYINLTLKHERTDMKMVTVHCTCVNYPWHIHASMVDSGPHFEV